MKRLMILALALLGPVAAQAATNCQTGAALTGLASTDFPGFFGPSLCYNPATNQIGVIYGTAAGTAPAGNDPRIVGALQTPSGPVVGYAIVWTAAGPVWAAPPSGAVGPAGPIGPQGVPGPAGPGFTRAPGVTYTASGALAVPAANTDTLAIVNCPSGSTCAMTLGAGVTDRQIYLIKRIGAGAVTVTANIDGAAGTMLTAASAGGKEMLALQWSLALSTWLQGSAQ